MQIPLKEGLFTWPEDNPQLLGSRCNACHEVAFPAQRDCRHCSGSDTTVIPIGNQGKLWTWTIQSFMPKPPYHSAETEETFEPYGVGYVEMPGKVRVESRLSVAHRDQLKIGMPLTLKIVPFRKDDEGNDLMTFVFSPAEEVC